MAAITMNGPMKYTNVVKLETSNDQNGVIQPLLTGKYIKAHFSHVTDDAGHFIAVKII